MGAYIQGNLALEKQAESKSSYRERKHVVYRKKTIPTQEKLLYLFTIAVCVLVAGAIIFRYAQIYEVNVQIQQMQDQIKALQNENQSLEYKIRQGLDPQTLLQKAQQLGMVPSDDQHVLELKQNSAADAQDKHVAMK